MLGKFQWSVVAGVAATMIVVFVLQSTQQVWMGGNSITQWGGLTVEALKQGQVWRLISYALLHDGFWHILANVLTIVLIGLPLQAELGQRATGVILGLMALAGGLAFSLVHAMGDGSLLVGGSAVAVGLITLFCLSYPRRPITLLLFFVLPVTVYPIWVLWATLGINLFGFIFGEIAPGGRTAVAYSAHLGGMLAAWAISRWCLRPGTAQLSVRSPAPEAPQWVNKPVIFPAGAATGQGRPTSRQALQRELDRILDKINTKGFGALSPQEKETLDKAKDILGK